MTLDELLAEPTEETQEAPAEKWIPALTVYQPWAGLLALNLKRYETRSWATPYRGLIAIHAGKSKQSLQWLVSDRRDHSAQVIRALLYAEKETWQVAHELGAVIAVAQLRAIYKTEAMRDRIHDQERLLGNYADKRFGWEIGAPVLLPEPIQAQGAQGLWNWQVPAELVPMLAECFPSESEG